MSIKTALIQLKHKLQGGENKVHTFIGIPPEEERNEFISATAARRSEFVEQWKKEKTISALFTLSIVWESILCMLHRIPGNLINVKDR